eukprot:1516916-Karenia_brevis.AAC.1
MQQPTADGAETIAKLVSEAGSQKPLRAHGLSSSEGQSRTEVYTMQHPTATLEIGSEEECEAHAMQQPTAANAEPMERLDWL